MSTLDTGTVDEYCTLDIGHWTPRPRGLSYPSVTMHCSHAPPRARRTYSVLTAPSRIFLLQACTSYRTSRNPGHVMSCHVMVYLLFLSSRMCQQT
jgi:hypothetical protein